MGRAAFICPACQLIRSPVICILLFMSTVRQIEAAVEKLSPQELAKFRQWFQDFDADAWDRQLEADVKAGRLDAMAEEALRDLPRGSARFSL